MSHDLGRFKQTTLRVSEQDFEQLTVLAAQQDNPPLFPKSVAAVVRDAVDDYLALRGLKPATARLVDSVRMFKECKHV